MTGHSFNKQTYASNRDLAVVLFRHTLKLSDHAALAKAVRDDYQILPVALETYAIEKHKDTRKAELESLALEVKKLGGTLVLCAEPLRASLSRILRHCPARTVYWNKALSAAGEKQDDELRLFLGSSGVETQIVSTQIDQDDADQMAMSLAGMTAQNFQEPLIVSFWQPQSSHVPTIDFKNTSSPQATNDRSQTSIPSGDQS